MYEDQITVEARHGRGEIDQSREYILGDSGAHMRLYRVVRSDPATADDFLSQYRRNLLGSAASRRPPPTDPRLLRIWDGVSMSATKRQAEQQRARYRRLGMYMAVMDLPVVRFRMERSTATPGHFTVWGDPGDLLQCVREVLLLT